MVNGQLRWRSISKIARPNWPFWANNAFIKAQNYPLSSDIGSAEWVNQVRDPDWPFLEQLRLAARTGATRAEAKAVTPTPTA